MKQPLAAAAGLALAGGALLAAWWPTPDATRVPPRAVPASHEEAGTALPPAADAPVAPAALAVWRREQSSLRGTELDGGWALDAQGRLQPSLALRRRFDHLLLLRDGEASTATLARAIQEDVQAAAGPAAAAQVLDLWQRYLGLLDTRFETRVELARPETWGPALAERQHARRDQLGLAWAQAFYAEEEAELQALINQQAGTQARGDALLAAAAPAPGVSVLGPQGLARATLTAEQRERLEAVDAEQARWAERLAQARREIGTLRNAAHLSDPQRREAVDAWLAQHFDAREQLRIRGLLELPPAGPP
ncbi:MAG TPA: lipase chaperone [Burkholderiaceae bacterium]|nr:lipase chaperone [Burkholderiaceae bacterium]